MLRKVFLVGALIALVPAAAFALSIDGTQTQGKGTFAVGIGSEYIIKKDLNLKLNPDTGVYYNSAKIKDLYRVYVRPSFGLIDGLDIYAKFGLTDYEGTEKANNVKTQFAAEQAFLSGVGMKASYEITDGIIWGADIGFAYNKNNVEYGAGTESWRMSEWHVAPYVGKLIGNFVPYIGVKYDDMRIKARTAGGMIYKYQAKNCVGMFSGFDYGIGEKVCLNLEGRFFNEYGVSASVNYRF